MWTRVERVRMRRARRLCTAVLTVLSVACADSPVSGSTGTPESTVGDVTLRALSASEVAGVVGTDVAEVPTVRATYADGRSAEGIIVFFSPDDAGNVTNLSVATDRNGLASASAWRLGGRVGTQRLVVHVAGSAKELVFTATAAVGAVARVVPVDGDAQLGFPNSTLRLSLTALVSDRFGNPVPGADVTFRTVSGSGFVENAIARTNASGVARSGAWHLGAQLGEQHIVSESNGTQAQFRAFAIDGQQELAYERDGQIFVRALNGPDVRLSQAAGLVDHPRWSADGGRIVFAKAPGDGNSFSSLYVINADNTQLFRLIDGGVGPSNRSGGLDYPTWSPDGRVLAFTRRGIATVEEILIADSTLMARSIAQSATHPAWSPDGTRLAYVGGVSAAGYFTIEIMKADGSQKQILVERDGSGVDSPTWSPDGQQIAFVKCELSCALHVIASDGSKPRILATPARGQNLSDPTWSPDGLWIAATRSELVNDEVVQNIVVIPASGGTPFELWNGRSPSWRPARGP